MRRFGLAAITLAIFLGSVLAPQSSPAQDLSVERGQMKTMLDRVANDVEKNYYDPQLHGLDWKALTQQARARIDKANSASEMLTAIFSLVNKLGDSHTVFIPPMRVDRPRFGFEAKAYGDKILVYDLTKDGAAKAAGLELGDEIVGVNNFTAERATYDTMMLYFHALRPVPSLDLIISRNGHEKNIHIDAKVKHGKMILELGPEGDLWDLIRDSEDETVFHYRNYPGGISYLEVPTFMADETFLSGLISKVQDSKAIILDLREDHGGSTDTLTSLAGYFEPQPAVLAQVVERKKTEPLKIKPHSPVISAPMFILVDSESASAAEMFARYFQRKGAVVIGDHSSGRVNAARIFSEELGVDRVVPFGIEISIGKVVLEGGEELEKKGVVPDEPCLPKPEDLHKELDTCRMRAVALARQKLGLPALPDSEKPAPLPEDKGVTSH